MDSTQQIVDLNTGEELYRSRVSSGRRDRREQRIEEFVEALSTALRESRATCVKIDRLTPLGDEAVDVDVCFRLPQPEGLELYAMGIGAMH